MTSRLPGMRPTNAGITAGRRGSEAQHNLAVRVRLLLFAFMLRNAVRAVDLFRIPTDNFIEIGRLVEI
jgi:K+ transporter